MVARSPQSMWLDPEAVLSWLLGQGAQVSGPLTITRIGAGQSNITSLVRDGNGGEWVLREPPPGTPAGTAHDVLREARILTALRPTDIPVPTVVGTGVGPSGLDFYVMSKVAGVTLESESDAQRLEPPARRRLGLDVVATLAHLHTIGPASVGLADLGPVTPYVPRQVRRIREAWARYGQDSRHNRSWTAVLASVEKNLPSDYRTVIVHGDFRLSNLLVSGEKVSAVLDWELSTLGDPLADLAWLLDDWRQPEDPAITMPSPTRAGGFPTRSDLMDTYHQITGLNLERLDYYRGFTQWRAASLLQGVLRRRRAGMMGDHGDLDLDALDASIAELIDSAAHHLGA